MYVSIIITIFLACYFQNKELKRAMASSLIILVVSFLVINPLFVAVIILPSLLLGIIATTFLKHKVRYSIYFPIVSTVCFGLNVVMELCFVRLIIGMKLFDYILVDDLFNSSAVLSTLGGWLIFIYMIVILIISLMETMIIYYTNKLYIRRIIPLLGEKLD